LHDFVCNILHGLFTWEKPQNTGVSYWELIAAPKICTKCGHTTGDVSVVVHKDKHFKDLHIYPFGRPGYRQVANLIKKHLTPEMMLPHKLGQVTFRFNDPRPGEYHCNQCYHCDKVYHHIHNGEPTAITEPTRMSTISIYLELPFGVDTGNDSAAWYCNGKRMKF
jgi:hypothetical protein